ncbi:beta-N-acetylhexosaminidase [Sphingomonas sp. CV7422]|uniref:beta-N-acetylhexosaminidase n=1 Tax=Sphingomonas sp. CV7422 TaxID=3018036 RepID=UPI0022FEC4DE|nr:family 20 glycosylhydrolase [Sphingomonas sp. CV7422]
MREQPGIAIVVGAALALLTAPAAARPAPPAAGELPLVPLPQSVTQGSGSFLVADGARVGTPPGDAGAAAAARLLAQHVRAARGIALAPVAGEAAIRFVRDATVTGDEAYRLDSDAHGIRISASGDRGLVHGAMTLAQLLSPDRAYGRPVAVPALAIADAPRFAWRGLMIDPARHFQPVAVLRDIVDQMAAVKLNTLHLHLSDDQGWRFEVRRYPKLTEVGAWRTPPSAGGPPGARVGGFYTQAELRGLVAYAAERGIVIVPEIDLPGHAQALVAAYPEHGVLGDRPAVGHDWGVNPYLLNPRPETVRFVEDILDELLAVFPGPYVHLGGDEAVKDQWERSPAVQAQMASLGLKTEMQMQSWLIGQLAAYLAKRNRRLIGWDEILEGELPRSAAVMSWRGEAGAVEAAKRGHDVVLSPGPTLYLDNAQSDQADEPPGRLAIQTLADLYRYDPLPAGIDAAAAGHILGAQGNAFSEYLITARQVQHAIFPRAAALAEISWSAPGARNFPGFVARLQPQIARWRRAGLEVADSAFAVTYTLEGKRGDVLRSGRMTVALATQAPLGTIRYTLDGSAPAANSRRYAAPLTLAPGATIRAAAFDAAGVALAAPRSFATDRQALLGAGNDALTACPTGSLALHVPLTADATADAPAYKIDLFDTCSVFPAAPIARARTIALDVARLPRPFGLAHEFTKLRAHYNVTPHGELVVTAGCPTKDAPRPAVLATFPLPDPASAPNRMRFEAALPPQTRDADLCLQFTSPLVDPLYVVDHVQLTEPVQ